MEDERNEIRKRYYNPLPWWAFVPQIVISLIAIIISICAWKEWGRMKEPFHKRFWWIPLVTSSISLIISGTTIVLKILK